MSTVKLDSKQLATLVLTVLNTLFFISTTIVYVIRGRHPNIRPTAPILTTVQALAALGITTTTIVLLGFKPMFPSFLFFWNINIFMLLWMCCVMARAMRLTILSHWHMGRLQETRERKFGNIFAFMKQSIASSLDGLDEDRDGWKGMIQKFRKNGLMQLKFIYEAYEGDQRDDLGRDPEQWFGAVVGKFVGIVMGLMVLGCVALQIWISKPVRLSPMDFGPDVRELVKTHLLTLEVVGAMFVVLFVPGFLYTIWTVRDINGIKVDIMITLITSVPSMILWAFYLFMVTDKVEELPVMYLSSMLFVIAHFTSVVLPIARSYHTHLSIFMMRQEDYNPTAFRVFHKIKTVAERKSMDDASNADSMDRLASKHFQKIHMTEHQFDRVLADPRLMEKFRTVAALDFSYTRMMLNDACNEIKAMIEAVIPERSPISPALTAQTLLWDDNNTIVQSPSSLGSASFIKSPPASVLRDLGEVPVERFDGSAVSDKKIMAVKRCKDIWKVFLKDEGYMMVDISEDARERYWQQIQSGRIERSVVDEVMMENLEALFKDVFPKFVTAYNSRKV
ncbi:hypothetical protein HDU97_001255 [Phlyctochytrium planicorne]|nr:hypothetical protein HDU97_001255 [Phlyctochytrium planicorne]